MGREKSFGLIIYGKMEEEKKKKKKIEFYEDPNPNPNRLYFLTWCSINSKFFLPNTNIDLFYENKSILMLVYEGKNKVCNFGDLGRIWVLFLTLVKMKNFFLKRLLISSGEKEKYIYNIHFTLVW